jgi:hypothetical protein
LIDRHDAPDFMLRVMQGLARSAIVRIQINQSRSRKSTHRFAAAAKLVQSNVGTPSGADWPVLLTI